MERQISKKIVYIFFILIFLFGTVLRAQYVRRRTFSTEHERRLQYALDDWISYLESKYISSVAVGTEYIYFGTLDGGILRYHLYENFWDFPFTTSNGLKGNRVLDVAFDENSGYLWAVTQPLEEPYLPPDTCIFMPADHEWYCKSQVSYWPYKFPSRGLPDTISKINYNIFYPAKYLNLLPTFFANGEYTLTGDWKILDDRFDEFPISGFLLDHWERVWFLIDGLGIGIGSTFSQRMDVLIKGLTHISPQVIQYQYNDLWIGGIPLPGRGRPGIVHWKDNDGSWEYYQARFIPQLRSDYVYDIESRGDSVWFATELGVTLFNTRKNRWKNFNVKHGLYSQEVYDLFLKGNILYIGTREGLNYLDLTTGKVRREKDDNIRLATIYQIAGNDSSLWLATNRGIFRYLDKKKKWEIVTTSAPIQDLPVYAVQIFGPEVWFTSPGGIFWLDTRTNQWESFPQIGLEVKGPYSDIEVNRKSVWVSTTEGLLKYDRERKYWLLFTTEDGLLDNQCRRLLLDGDYIWIATRSGITQFYWNNPNRID